MYDYPRIKYSGLITATSLSSQLSMVVVSPPWSHASLFTAQNTPTITKAVTSEAPPPLLCIKQLLNIITQAQTGEYISLPSSKRFHLIKSFPNSNKVPTRTQNAFPGLR